MRRRQKSPLPARLRSPPSSAGGRGDSWHRPTTRDSPHRPAPLPQPAARLYNTRQMTAESQNSDRYNAREAEARWQKTWDQRGIFKTANDDPRPKYYVLEM